MIAIGAALAIGTNYLLLPLENVKLMDFIVFTIGFLAGPYAGAATGVLTWAVYGTVNPAGYSFPVWVGTMFAETFYGVAGGLLSGRLSLGIKSHPADKIRVQLGLLAFGLTLAYDLITTIPHALAYGALYNLNTFLAYLGLSVPFFVMHEASNLVIFSTIAVPVLRSVTRNFKGST